MLSYNEIRGIYEKSLSHARSLPRQKIGDDTVIVAETSALPAALILYTNCLHAGQKCTLAPPTLASTSIVPYRETGRIIAFTRNPKSLRIVNLAEAAGLLGLDVTIVAPRLHPAVGERLESAGASIVEVREPSLLEMSIAATLWTPPLMGARWQRVLDELEELGTALEWVHSKVTGRLSSLQQAKASPPLYTPIAAPGAWYHCLAAKCGVPIPLEAAATMEVRPSVVYVSSVEQHDYRDLLAYPRRGIDRGLIVTINSDPVTAGLYSVLAALLITGTPI